jgi:hypothetical protein
MKQSSSELSVVASVDAASKLIENLQAVGIGAVVVVGGSLVMTMLIGVAAIVGMLVRGDSGPTIVAQISGSFELALLCAIGGCWMSLVGGYTSALMVDRSPIQHGLWTGALATPLSLAVVAVLGDSGPLWLTVLSIVLILPCAGLGGWLAAPRHMLPVAPEMRK